jgi:hypothetical protein
VIIIFVDLKLTLRFVFTLFIILAISVEPRSPVPAAFEGEIVHFEGTKLFVARVPAGGGEVDDSDEVVVCGGS